ncbi:MAG: hypothetical protein WCG93_05660 [Paludibacter sp.]
MPKGVFIQDEKVMERFRTVVQDSIPFSLKINKNISKFAQLIFSKTRNPISESTLKRLFLYPDITIPSLYTLDTVCQAIGFADWNDFTTDLNQLSEYEHYEIFSVVKHNGYNGWEEFRTIVNRFKDSAKKYEVVLVLVDVAIQKKDVETLKRIFDLPALFEILHDNRPQYYFLQELGLKLRNSEMIYDLIPHYAKHPVAQVAYIERTVDEDHLNGYYGVLLEEYHKHKTNLEAQLFYHCLMFQRERENGNHRNQHFDFLVSFRETVPVHVIPKMRRLALLVAEFQDDADLIESLLEEIPALLPENEENYKLHNAYVFCNIVFHTQNAYPIKCLLKHLNMNTDVYRRNIVSVRNLNLLKIYEAFVLLKDNQPELANAKLQTYNHLYFSPNHYKRYTLHYDTVKAMINNKP